MSRAETVAAAKARQAEHGGAYRAALAFVMAERDAYEWNALYPVGTAVIMSPYSDCPDAVKVTTKTRSFAWVVGEHASVLLEGKSGSYGLSHIKAVSP